MELSKYNQVSPQWIIDEEGHIVGINHLAIGNSFKQKCEKKVCNVSIQNRADDNKDGESSDSQDVKIDGNLIKNLIKKIEDLEKKLVDSQSSGKAKDVEKEKEPSGSDKDNSDNEEVPPDTKEKDKKKKLQLYEQAIKKNAYYQNFEIFQNPPSSYYK